MGIRIGDELAYVTDTVVDEGTVGLARGTKLLLHEVWMTDDELATDEVGAVNHSNVSGVAEIAKAAGVDRLMMIHNHPKRTAEELSDMAREIQRLSGIDVVVPIEAQVYDL